RSSDLAETTPYGVVHSVMLAQSTDYERNLRASSGGIIKELLASLLARDDVDGAIVLQHVDGLDFQPGLITDLAEVDRLPGSVYHNLPKHGALELLRANEGRYVLAAIPCELEGIYNFVFKREPHLRERIHTTIGLLCVWQYNWHSIRAICEYKGADPYRIVDASAYRGKWGRSCPHRRRVLPRRWPDRQAAHPHRRRPGDHDEPPARLRLPGRVRPQLQHAALPSVHQPLQLPGRHRGRRCLAGQHPEYQDRHQPRHQPPRGERQARPEPG